MKTLVCSQSPPNPTSITQPTSWNPRISILQHISMTSPVPNLRKWKLQAEAKGFAGSASDSLRGGKKTIRKEAVEQKNSDRKIEDDKIPDGVYNRIIVRILSFVGIPLMTGMVLLHIIGMVKEQHLVDVPYWFAYLTIFITFGASALGIAWGTLSASWDPEKEGSLLGFEEAQQNWVEMWREDEGNS
ncbi:PAM68-like [Dillenia turbinata]|uniref:PAM68-like n=1 Tax=Dillenia turbinata TaxID=194707 RepID=A0AAN8V1P8_9MAGN